MDPGNYNPYAPPKTICTPAEFDSLRKSQGSLGLAIAAGVYFFAYTAFTLLLLTSPSPGDKAAGKLFLLNIPTLIALVVYTHRSKRLGVFISNTFVCLQLGLTIAMFRIPNAEWRAIIIINAIVVAPVLTISTLAWVIDLIRSRKNLS